MNIQFRRLLRGFWLGVGACLLTAVAWAQSLTVIDLQYRRAEDLIPVLQPLLEQGGALTGQDYKLFVRTSSSNLAQLRSAVAQLDKQQRQMLVSVRRSTALDIQQEQASASGTLSTRDGVSGTVRAGERNVQTKDSSVSSVQVLEGNAAFIATGTSVPIVTAVAVGGGKRPFVAGAVEHRNLQRGFMVTPRVNGDQVILEIAQQDERVTGGGIQSQSLNTQVIGRLGSWIQLGGVSESSSSTSSGILSRSYSTGGNELSVWVKVDPQ
ncbi:secretin N-terminal domain-containing protein [Steroidobacter cummioxidans]|uniref:secretin N-terminal domain-containing protein n=1 Tax=Steroidobacter cummioxidans TaxID=1803913 RepID=UPI000E323088|nr:secretin N-terminal domain-containing protein [Steroidobacter cummioxidans]